MPLKSNCLIALGSEAPVAAFGLWLACAALAHAEDVVRTPVTNARPVLLAALSATDGKAHGILTGELADAITRRFEATTPIYIDVTTLHRYEQPGCARLNALFWQDGVKLPGAQQARRQTIEFALNYCLDGLPPKSLR